MCVLWTYVMVRNWSEMGGFTFEFGQQEVSPRTSGRLSHSSGPLNGSLTDSPPVSPSEIDDFKVLTMSLSINRQPCCWIFFIFFYFNRVELFGWVQSTNTGFTAHLEPTKPTMMQFQFQLSLVPTKQNKKLGWHRRETPPAFFSFQFSFQYKQILVFFFLQKYHIFFSGPRLWVFQLCLFSSE